jgi:hypothetical protein
MEVDKKSSGKWQWWPCFLCPKDQLSFLNQIDLCTLCRISSRLQFGRVLTLHGISVWGWSGKHYYLGLKEHCRVLFLQELYCCMSLFVWLPSCLPVNIVCNGQGMCSLGPLQILHSNFMSLPSSSEWSTSSLCLKQSCLKFMGECMLHSCTIYIKLWVEAEL